MAKFTPKTKYRPNPEGVPRKLRSDRVRLQASTSHHNSIKNTLKTLSNGDEKLYGNEGRASNFTKGLLHDEYGFSVGPYEAFTVAINDKNPDFEKLRPKNLTYTSKIKGSSKPLEWRGWESPRTGHYYDLEGPDADAVGMAAAPGLGSDELVGEMAEVYAMAMVRDIPFTAIEDETGCDENTLLDVKTIAANLRKIPFFNGTCASYSLQSRRRLAGRFIEPDGKYDVDNPTACKTSAVKMGALFRGSGPGAKKGPFVSQFMLLGNEIGHLKYTPKDGYIAYGNQLIDQRVRVFEKHRDYMTNWNHYLDVQNGANLKGAHKFDGQRFITTPRDLATYVRFDALYQAYLNACLMLLGINFGAQEGFPENDKSARTGFASFGGPHILSLVTEVATRCLKAARRQKFNFHRRGRPERVAGLLTVAKAVKDGRISTPPPLYGKKTRASSEVALSQLADILDMVGHHNALRDSSPPGKNPTVISKANPKWLQGPGQASNYLLAMAFPEGSPMHPAYAAGHATVAGGCVTMLKAFFKTVDKNFKPLPWTDTKFDAWVAKSDGRMLVKAKSTSGMTVEGELNKLAANISIARNMAGVHFYSDYYDSLRMGERTAVGILIEQLYGYDEAVIMKFRSFDGDQITLSTSKPDKPKIVTSNGKTITYQKWLARHVDVPGSYVA